MALMIVPIDKHDDMTQLDDCILSEVIKISKECMKILKKNLIAKDLILV